MNNTLERWSRTSVTRADAECCLSNRDRSVVRLLRCNAGSELVARVVARHFCNRQTLRARTRYPRTALRRFVLPRRRQLINESATRGRPINRSATLGLTRTLPKRLQVYGLLVGTGVEPATSRLTSGALSTELTGVVDSTSPSLESMFGTHGANR